MLKKSSSHNWHEHLSNFDPKTRAHLPFPGGHSAASGQMFSPLGFGKGFVDSQEGGMARHSQNSPPEATQVPPKPGHQASQMASPLGPAEGLVMLQGVSHEQLPPPLLGLHSFSSQEHSPSQTYAPKSLKSCLGVASLH